MLDLLRERRSIRKFLGKKIPQPIIENLKEAALRSPTSRNRKAWKFWFVQDKNLLHQLSAAKAAGSTLIANAPLAIVVGAERGETDVWVEDCSIASIVLQMVAQEEGLGSCWVQIRKRFDAQETSSEHIVQSLLNLPETTAIESIIAIGYPDEEKASILKEDLKEGATFDL